MDAFILEGGGRRGRGVGILRCILSILWLNYARFDEILVVDIFFFLRIEVIELTGLAFRLRHAIKCVQTPFLNVCVW